VETGELRTWKWPWEHYLE